MRQRLCALAVSDVGAKSPACPVGIWRKRALLAFVSTTAVLGFGTSSWAQCTSTATGSTVIPGTVTVVQNSVLLNAATSGIASTAGGVLGAINTMDTAFLAQGSAFVTNPAVQKPDVSTDGVWSRMVGGQAATSSTGAVGGAQVLGNNVTGTTNCGANVRQEYGGVQAGADIGKLNWGGGNVNVHFGITGGYAESSAHDNDAPTSLQTQAAFVGGYGTLTAGNFFTDLMVRENFYQIRSIEAPVLELHDGGISANGTSVSGNAGYYVALPNSAWFVEPSAGFVYSAVNVGNLTIPGNIGIHGLVSPGVLQFNQVQSTLGRLGVRLGTNVNIGNVAVQPFVVASVWHEFEGPATSMYSGSFASLPTTFQVSSSRIGTYGQYSAGAAAQLANSSWAGYARLDVREGPNIQGIGVNGGLRYTFDPQPSEAVTAKAQAYPKKAPLITKAPPPKVVSDPWSGCYLGVQGGYGWGTSSNDAASASNRLADETPGNFSSSPKGGIAGGQMGCNYQASPNWVVGIETEGWRSWMQDTASAIGHEDIPVTGDLHTLQAQNMWDAALSARLGFVTGQALLYVKGGGAYGSFQYTFIDSADFHDFDVNSARFGWIVGAGIEYMLTQNWSAKIEYDYLSFGNNNISTFLTSPHEGGANITGAHTPYSFNVSETKNIVKGGFNFKF
jgi:outer membrane autotransporter protein